MYYMLNNIQHMLNVIKRMLDIIKHIGNSIIENLMKTEQMINMATAYKGISQAALARALGMTASNFNQKIKRDTFNKAELAKIAAALDGVYNSFFEFPSGIKIGTVTPKKGTNLTKEEALELLKASGLLVIHDSNNKPVYCHIGEYIETETAFSWVIYRSSPEKPDDRTFAFMHYVDKTTRKVRCANTPLSEMEFKFLQTALD